MCEGCYIELGRPAIRNGRTMAAVPLIDAVFDEGEFGGNVFIVLRDWNLEDEHVTRSADRAETPAERACMASFAAMSELERASALAMSVGWLEALPPTSAE